MAGGSLAVGNLYKDHVMWHNWRWIWLASLVLALGCGARPTTLNVRGEVSYDGRPVERGQIEFSPVDNTPGPSAIAAIDAGRYEVSAKWGLRSEGVYRVRILAYKRTNKKEPNRVDRGGPPIDVEENFLPPNYNSESTLMVRVAELQDESKVDFHLANMPAAPR
jgi:hypothetical protein